MFVILVSAGFKNGASMFTLSDVNLLFPAPIRPRAVLYYGLFRQLGASLLLGLFLLFQYGWLHSLYGVGVGILILIVVLYGGERVSGAGGGHGRLFADQQCRRAAARWPRD